MHFSILASSSDGNCLLVVDGDTRILIDAGISCRRITHRLADLGVSLESLSGVCITHEHNDHISALPTLSRKLPIPLYATNITSSVAEDRVKLTNPQWHIFEPGNSFQIGSLTIEAFAVPHDAADPVGFVIDNGRRRLGVATDLGFVPTMVEHHLKRCHTGVLECNHDIDMLRNSDRPWSIKDRIMDRHGHLSNVQCSELVESLIGGNLDTLVLAHISNKCNTPALARNTILDLLDRHGKREEVELHLASPEPMQRMMKV